MPTEQDAEDISVYDLAEKAARGQPLTDAAHREIAQELLTLRNSVRLLAERVDPK